MFIIAVCCGYCVTCDAILTGLACVDCGFVVVCCWLFLVVALVIWFSFRLSSVGGVWLVSGFSSLVGVPHVPGLGLGVGYW